MRSFYIRLAAATIMVHTASGAIVYTDVFPDLTANRVDCDLNNDGVVDFYLQKETSSGGHPQAVWREHASLGLYAVQCSTPEGPPSDKVERKAAGDVIAPGDSIGSQGYKMPGGAGYLFDNSRGPTGFEWSVGARGFLAIQLYSLVDKHSNFGWAEVSIDGVGPDSFTYTLYGYALEEEPHIPIIAGAVPEPSSAALIACAFGLACAQRRR